MNTIERVARAIYAAEGNQTREPGGEWRPTRLDEEEVEHQQLYSEYARAAIEAMRPLLEAARDHIKGTTGARPGSDSEEIVQMIDAALEEGK